MALKVALKRQALYVFRTVSPGAPPVSSTGLCLGHEHCGRTERSSGTPASSPAKCRGGAAATTLGDGCRVAMHAAHPLRPAQLADGVVALRIVDQVLNVQHHARIRSVGASKRRGSYTNKPRGGQPRVRCLSSSRLFAGALALPMSHFPTDTSVHGCEIRGRAIDRGQLNGDPVADPVAHVLFSRCDP